MSSPMDELPEHFPIDVDVDGNGPVHRDDPRYDRTVCWCSTPGCQMHEHQLRVDGPIRYPGGKDGTYVVLCSCKGYSSPPGSAPDSARMWQAARHHQAAKGAPQ